MNFYRKGLSVVLAMSMLAGTGTAVFAQSVVVGNSMNKGEPIIAICPPTYEQDMQVSAVVKAALKDGVLMVTVNGQDMLLRVHEKTTVVDSKTGKCQTGFGKLINNLKVGESIQVFCDPVMTASLPPQTNVNMVIINHQKTEDQSIDNQNFKETATVQKVISNGMLLVAVNGEEILLKVNDKTHVLDDKSGLAQIGQGTLLENLKVGDTIIATYSKIMTRSLPPQSNVENIVVNPKQQSIENKLISGVAVVKEKLSNSMLLVAVNDQEILLKVHENTTVIDAQKGLVESGEGSLLENLKVGECISVAYSPLMTYSLPPQSNVESIVLNYTQDLLNGKENQEVPVYEQTLEAEALVKETFAQGRLLVTVEGQDIALKIHDDTFLVDAQTGTATNLESLKVGDTVLVYYSPMMTRSLPPQSNAKAVITNIQKDKLIPRMFSVKEIVSQTDKEVRVLNQEGDLILTVLKENPLMPYKTKQMVGLNDIKEGTQLLVWYGPVAYSYPGLTTAEKTVVLAQGETQEETLGIKPVLLKKLSIHKNKIKINGKMISLGKDEILIQNDHVMIPLRTVSEALGFKVKWDHKINGVRLDNGSVKTEVVLGEDGYHKASSKALGLTQNFKFGAKPEMVHGTLYVPAELFNLLYSDNEAVKVVGDTLVIQNS